MLTGIGVNKPTMGKTGLDRRPFRFFPLPGTKLRALGKQYSKKTSVRVVYFSRASHRCFGCSLWHSCRTNREKNNEHWRKEKKTLAHSCFLYFPLLSVACSAAIFHMGTCSGATDNCQLQLLLQVSLSSISINITMDSPSLSLELSYFFCHFLKIFFTFFFPFFIFIYFLFYSALSSSSIKRAREPESKRWSPAYLEGRAEGELDGEVVLAAHHLQLPDGREVRRPLQGEVRQVVLRGSHLCGGRRKGEDVISGILRSNLVE